MNLLNLAPDIQEEILSWADVRSSKQHIREASVRKMSSEILWTDNVSSGLYILRTAASSIHVFRKPCDVAHLRTARSTRLKAAGRVFREAFDRRARVCRARLLASVSNMLDTVERCGREAI